MNEADFTDILKKLRGPRVWVTGFLLYSGVVYYLAMRPIDPGGAIGKISGLDKLLHGGEFLLFFLIGFKALDSLAGTNRGKLVALIAGSLIFAGITEASQMAVGFRSASIVDWYADFAGIGVGLISVKLASWLSGKRESQ